MDSVVDRKPAARDDSLQQRLMSAMAPMRDRSDANVAPEPARQGPKYKDHHAAAGALQPPTKSARRSPLKPRSSLKLPLKGAQPWQSDNKYLGVRLHSKGRWKCEITVNRQTIYLGAFAVPEEGAQWYDAACLLLHGPGKTRNFAASAYSKEFLKQVLEYINQRYPQVRIPYASLAETSAPQSKEQSEAEADSGDQATSGDADAAAAVSAGNDNSRVAEALRLPFPRGSKYMGVYLCKNGRWKAAIRFGKKSRFLGNFSAEIEGARWYDAACLLLYGLGKTRNFPQTTYNSMFLRDVFADFSRRQPELTFPFAWLAEEGIGDAALQQVDELPYLPGSALCRWRTLPSAADADTANRAVAAAAAQSWSSEAAEQVCPAAQQSAESLSETESPSAAAALARDASLEADVGTSALTPARQAVACLHPAWAPAPVPTQPLMSLDQAVADIAKQCQRPLSDEPAVAADHGLALSHAGMQAVAAARAQDEQQTAHQCLVTLDEAISHWSRIALASCRVGFGKELMNNAAISDNQQE